MAKVFRIAGCIAILVCATVALPAGVEAQQSMDQVYRGFNLNASLGVVIPGTDEFGNSAYIRGGGGYEINENLAVDIALGRFAVDVDNDLDAPPPNTIADGDLTVIPLTATLQYRHLVPQIYGTVYGLAGLGYYFIDYSWSSSAEEYFAEVEALYGTARQDVSSSFGIHLGGGFEYPLTSQLSLGAEGQYLFLKPSADGAWRDLLTGAPRTFDDSIDLSSWILSVGIKFVF
jgi:opacity protein-like surface antigen